MSEDFKNSLAQLPQVQSRLARENNEHVLMADVITRDVYEMRKGLLEIQAEGHRSQGRLEASMASINDLIKQRESLAVTRMSEMSTIIRERDHQVDECLKLMSDMILRRDSDANNRMVDLMTTMQDITVRVRALVTQAAAAPARPAPVPESLNLANIPSTSAAHPPTQTTYRKIAQRSG